MCRAARTQPGGRGARRGGFSLVELLIILGILAVLASLLLPALNAARRNANTVCCATNVRGLCQALLMYAQDNNGRFPPNTDLGTPQYWYDEERLGKYISRTTQPATGKNPAAVWAPAIMGCPADPDSARSYAMNFWASSKVDNIKLTAKPQRGTLWSTKTDPNTQLILVTERFVSVHPSTSGPWYSSAYVGYAGTTPGQRFGAGGGLAAPIITRWGPSNCELHYARHRVGRSKKETDARGCINIGYADGHVELRTEGMLADFSTGKSRLDSLWSPLDTDPAFNK